MFSIQLQDTNREENNDIDVVVKNTPFLIIVNVNDSKTTNNSFSFTDAKFNKDDVVVHLVYDDESSENLGVTYRKTKPLDYNIYLKEHSMTIETRIHVLSSKHENNCFRVSVDFKNQHLVTDSIKCVSKLDNKKKRQASAAAPVVPNSPELSHDEHVVQTAPKSTGKRKQSEAPSSPPTITAANNNTNNTTLTKAVKKLRSQQKKDRELISLLYKQNIMLLNQVNSLTNGLNSLITVHNDGVSQPSTPSSAISYSPVSPSLSAPTSPHDFYPTINADGLDNLSTEQYNFAMPSDDANQIITSNIVENNNSTGNSTVCMPAESYQCRSDLSNPITVADFSLYNDHQVIQTPSNFATNIQYGDIGANTTNTSLILQSSLSLFNSSYSHSSILDLNNLDFSNNNSSCNQVLLDQQNQQNQPQQEFISTMLAFNPQVTQQVSEHAVY